MKSAVDRREAGIPGSDASAFVEAMGGPVVQRASRGSGGRAGVINLKRTPSLDAMEEPLDTDVLPGTNEEEWEPVRYPRSEIRRRLAEQNARSKQIASERRPAGKPNPAWRSTDDLPGPRRRGHLHGGVTLLLGALTLVLLYLVVGWGYSAFVGIANRLSYGPMPTTYLDAVVGDNDSPTHPTRLVAMNEHGTIVIQVAPGGDFSRAATYVVSGQTSHAWGNPDDVVVTFTVDGTGPAPNILVELQGDPDLSHFYQRPSAAFLLLNQRPGFKVGPLLS